MSIASVNGLRLSRFYDQQMSGLLKIEAGLMHRHI